MQGFAELALVEVLPAGNGRSLALACSDHSRADDLREYLRRYGGELDGGLDPGDRGYTDRQLGLNDWLAVVPGPLGQRAWEKLAPSSAIVVPLRFEGRRLGRLTLARSSSGRPLRRRGARGCGRAREARRDGDREQPPLRARAGAFQSAAAEPGRRGAAGHPVVSAATRYVAGSSDLEVGGDWFDLIERDDGRIAVIVGDVVGRGLRAATAMGKLRSAVGALALVSDGPAEILERLDRFAAGIAEAELATVVCALLSPQDGTLVYSSAGHLPGLVVGAGGETMFLEDGRGFPLGVDVTAARGEGQALLDTGATLLFFTDGLVEAPNLPIEDGLERLSAAAGAGADQHPERLCDDLLDTLVSRLRDDIALVCVRFSPVPSEYQVWRYPAEADRLAAARHAFGAWLDERGVAKEARADLVLAYSEACSNAVRHAYVDCEGTISVHLRYDEGLLTINVSDSGRWSEPDPVPDDGGRGLEMIRELVDDMHVHGTPYGTTVVMAKQVELEPLGAVGAAAGFSRISAG